MYTTSKKITNNDAKNIISGQDVILVDDSSINAYIDSTNYYNAGVYGWNYSIGWLYGVVQAVNGIIKANGNKDNNMIQYKPIFMEF